MKSITVEPEQVSKETPLDPKIQKSLTYSTLDGFFYAIKVGIGASFFAPFAIFMHASNIHLALLTTMPQVAGSVLQMYSNKLLDYFHSRKKLVCAGVFLQAAMLIPIPLVFFMGRWQVHFLLLFASLYWIFGMLIGPIWNSWMGDLVPEDRRGTYFGRRSRIIEMASFGAMLLGGFILSCFNGNHGDEYPGFATLFILAFLARMSSFYFLTKKYDPEYTPRPGSNVTFLGFLRQLRIGNGNYLIFFGLMCSMNFAVYFSAPFFAPHMLVDLNIDYMTYTMINASAIVSKFLMMGRWGRLCDQFGTKKVLVLTGFAMPIVPILWVFCGEVWYLILIQIYSGMVWAGFEIASFNFMFDITTREQRVAYVSYYNVLNGIAILLGGIAGGLVVRFDPVFESRYLLLFLVSGILRYVISCVCLFRLKEVRTTQQISYSQLFFKVVATLPNQGVLHHAFAFRKK